jgi:ABC-type lipoprotein release transport system permease subunit
VTDPEQLTALSLSASVFRVLGANAAVGHVFTDEETRRRDTDPLTFIGAAAALSLTALAASYIPALRAARVDPAAMLRAE